MRRRTLLTNQVVPVKPAVTKNGDKAICSQRRVLKAQLKHKTRQRQLQIPFATNASNVAKENKLSEKKPGEQDQSVKKECDSGAKKRQFSQRG